MTPEPRMFTALLLERSPVAFDAKLDRRRRLVTQQRLCTIDRGERDRDIAGLIRKLGDLRLSADDSLDGLDELAKRDGLGTAEVHDLEPSRFDALDRSNRAAHDVVDERVVA